MFGMGFTEMLFIAVIAVLFLGPEKLPETMVDIARFFKKIKGTIADTKSDLERELSISDLKAEMLSYKSQLDDMSEEIKEVSPTKMLQSEIDDINKTIVEANPMAEMTRLATEDNSSPAKPAEPKQEAVTFPKKKTPIVSADDTNDDTKKDA